MKLILTLFLSLFITQANAIKNIIICQTTLSQETRALLKDLSYDQALKQAKQGDAQAQYALGVMYGAGIKTSEDKRRSIKWLTKAAVNDIPKARENLYGSYLCGTELFISQVAHV
jgi:TPR repeat protein